MSLVPFVSSTAIAPLDALRVNPELDGSMGTNRAIGSANQKIAANDDLSAVRAWYMRFTNSPKTLDAYKREAERVVLWAVCYKNKPLSSLSHEDFLDYETFLQEPPSDWISKTKHPRTHPDWRPFSGKLTGSSITHAMGILSNLMMWLVDAGYLQGNPLSLRRKQRMKRQKRLTRYLDPAQWEAVLRYIETMPRSSTREIDHYERSRWAFRLFYLAGMRISEVCENTMGCFERSRTRDGVMRWNLVIVGKGQKERVIPVGEDLLVALQRYRRHLELAPLPSPTETYPLVASMRNKILREAVARQAMDKIVKAVFAGAVDMLEKSQDEYDRNSALIIDHASAHWIRHTAGSHMGDAGVDLRYIRDFFGHGDLQTTSIYLHSDEQARHESITKLHKIGVE
jgi:integrase/recombinase XerD